MMDFNLAPLASDETDADITYRVADGILGLYFLEVKVYTDDATEVTIDVVEAW
ncbi:MAG: hypothetical protein V2I33_21430 [Kangiellaceae bacterium]|jgi:hypothetical protein|nr:hypothetical protein [Kangiellaceae bacterium]